MPVIFFHAGIPAFGGGFVGVDVFFVISGYLITSIILGELDQGRFSILRFYERRARRILPALFFVLAACLPAAWLLLMPRDLNNFGQSLVAVSLFVSNILFYAESGYFDTASELKPLLHTWTLAVEEQYYIFFPPFLALLWAWRKQWVFAILSLMLLGSIALAEALLRVDAMAAFFLLPTRGWELLIGSLCALYLSRGSVAGRSVAAQGLSLVGLAMIVLAVFVYTKQTPFPGIYALLPTVGTALIILFAGDGTLVRRVLSWRAMVGVGLISYSAYLWHQPLFAFLRHSQLTEPSLTAYLALSALTLVMAWLSWKYVEAPFREKGRFSRGSIFAFSLAGLAGFTAVGWSFWHFEGFPQRSVTQRFAVQILDYRYDNQDLRDESWGPLRARSGDSAYGRDNNDSDRTAWFDPQDKRPNLLVVGNSHSKDIYNILANSRYADEAEIARFGTDIAPAAQTLFDTPNYVAADIIVIASRYQDGDVEALPSLIERMLGDGKRIALVRSTFEFPQYREETLTEADLMIIEAARAGGNADGRKDRRDGADLASEINQRHFELYSRNADDDDGRLQGQAGPMRTRFPALIILDRMDYACDRAARICPAVDERLNKFYFDYGHNTLEGAAFFGQRVSEVGWLDPLFEPAGDQPPRAR